MKYNIPFGKNWRFGFQFLTAEGTPVDPQPTDTVVEIGNESVVTALIDGATCLLESQVIADGATTTTAGRLYSPTTLGGASPLEYNFTIECLPATAGSLVGDAGAEEAKGGAAAMSAHEGRRSRR